MVKNNESSQKSLKRILEKGETFPHQKSSFLGESVDEHRAVETANILLAQKELGQQNENS